MDCTSSLGEGMKEKQRGEKEKEREDNLSESHSQFLHHQTSGYQIWKEHGIRSGKTE